MYFGKLLTRKLSTVEENTKKHSDEGAIMIFKIHYGLWYGGLVGIIPFMFNYAVEYSGATATQHGILYTILPFVALLAKPMVCSVADKYAAHHRCLLFFIFTTIIGYGSLALYPFFPDLILNHKQAVWVLYCVAAFIGNTSMCVVNSIGDSLAINSCQRKDTSYGQYRLWGPVGFGIFGAIWGIANEIPSMPKYTPGIITMVAILIMNSLFLAFWYDREEFKVVNRVVPQVIDSNPNYGSTQFDGRVDGDMNVNGDVMVETPKVGRTALLWRLFKLHPSIFAYLFLFTFCGIMTGIHWQFFFRYLEQVAASDNTSFSTVATLALPVQALGGELVFFMCAGAILEKIGASMTLVVCLLSFTARYLFYAFLIPNVSVYWILLVELLQGPAFGLMYCVLTHQASYYSEKIDDIVAYSASPSDTRLKNSLHATLQGVLGAAFEGLGLGFGAIIGGLSYDANPILMWKIAGFSALIVAVLYSIGTYLMPKRRPINDVERNHRGEQENELMNEGHGDEGALDELRRIARMCQSDTGRPPVRETSKQLEELKEKLDTNSN